MVKSIAVRRAPARAYNPQRPVSDLLRAHIRNLEAVTGQSAAPAPRRKPKNEAQASAYIAELTRQIPNLYSTTEPAPPDVSGAPPPDVAALARLALKPRRRKKTGKSVRRSASAPASRAAVRKSARPKARRKTGKRRPRTSPRNPRRS